MKIGFIGAGNMAKAIFAGMEKSNQFNKNDIFVNSRTKETLDFVSKNFGYNIDLDVNQVVKSATDIIFICVKPQIIDSIATNIKANIGTNQVVVSIAAGKTLDYLRDHFGTNNVIRIMPNTPCLVGAGMSAVSYDKTIFETPLLSKKLDEVLKIVNAMGDYEVVDEKYIDVITQVSGASPAWIFMLIEALADGGVLCGMPRDMAYKFASNAVYGAGKLAKDKNIHPGILKDMVTSPAGTTIEGVKVLEEKGFRGALIDAVVVAYNKTKKI